MPEPEKKATPTMEELQAKLEQQQAQLTEQEQVRQAILADPDMKALLTLKQQGKKLKVVEETTQQEPIRQLKPFGPKQDGQQVSQEDVNQLSNKELLDLIGDSMESFLDQKLQATMTPLVKSIENTVAPLKDGLTKIQQAMVSQALATGAQTLRSNYPDFDQYSKDVNTLVLRNGLSQEEAYLLLKAKKVKDTPPAEQVETEHPFQIPVRSTRANADPDEDGGEPRTVMPRGTAGFREILQKGADRAFRRRATGLQ